MMLHQRLAITAATPNLIPMPAAHAPLGRSTRQIAVRPLFLHLENRRSHSSNPHRSQRRNRAPSGPRFRALALLGRLSWERVDGFVMQASEKPAQFRTSQPRSGTQIRSPYRNDQGGHLTIMTIVLQLLLGKYRCWFARGQSNVQLYALGV